MLRFIALLLALLSAGHAHATEAGWALLREGGYVVLLRHANAPGAAEPANFDIEKCATQRNLSDRGRQQAKRIGALFAARAAPVEKVLTSNYCRCRDTARFAFGDRLVETYEPLDFLPGDEEGNDEKAAELTQFIVDYTDSGNLVMVVNEDVVDRLVGVKPREGEAIIVGRDGENLRVAARIRFN
jgi:phosphohistidine phosphatase SixA